MIIDTKFKIGERVLIPAGTKTTRGTQFLKDIEDTVKDIQISITKKGISIRYHLEEEWDVILKEEMLRKI